MVRKSNRSIIREIKKSTYQMIKQTHDLEIGGKKRTFILSKSTNGHSPIVSMLTHTKNLIHDSIGCIDNQIAKPMIESYFRKFSYYEQMVEKNCVSKKPLKKKIVSRMLTSHTKLFNYLLSDPIYYREIRPINLNDLHYMVLFAVMVWNNDFKK